MEKIELRNIVAEVFGEVYATQKEGETPPVMSDEDVLLESGLDSLGFAILVVFLEERLGYDPFSLSTESYYPRTFGDFVDFYFRNMPK